MKQLFKSISVSLIFLLCSTFALAKSPIATVTKLKGNVFSITDGKTRQVKRGDFLYDFSQLITEVGSEVVFNDYYDHVYQLSGSGHLQLLNKAIELKSGYLWINSYQKEIPFLIQTANATVSFREVETVVSYDFAAEKTQVLTVKGDVELANILDTMKRTVVTNGEFSFVKRDYEDGYPRRPTPIGESSHKRIFSLFSLKNIKEPVSGPRGPKVVTRKVASVEKIKLPIGDQGEVTYLLKDKKKKKEQRAKLDRFYKAKVSAYLAPPKKKKFKPTYDKRSNVKVKVFGSTKWKTASRNIDSKKVSPTLKSEKSTTLKSFNFNSSGSSARKPASIGKMTPEINGNVFEKGLMQEYKKQMRHTNEVNQLIDELKSYDQDYKKAY